MSTPAVLLLLVLVALASGGLVYLFRPLSTGTTERGRTRAANPSTPQSVRRCAMRLERLAIAYGESRGEQRERIAAEIRQCKARLKTLGVEPPKNSDALTELIDAGTMD